MHVPKSQYLSLDRMRQKLNTPLMDPVQMMKQMQIMMNNMNMSNPQGSNQQQPPMPFMMPGMMNMMPNMMNMMNTARGGRNLPKNMSGQPQNRNYNKKPETKKQFSTVADVRNNLSEFTKLD